MFLGEMRKGWGGRFEEEKSLSKSVILDIVLRRVVLVLFYRDFGVCVIF